MQAESYPLDVNVALPLECAELPPGCKYGDIINFPLVQGKPQRMREPAWASIHPDQKYVLVKNNALQTVGPLRPARGAAAL